MGKIRKNSVRKSVKRVMELVKKVPSKLTPSKVKIMTKNATIKLVKAKKLIEKKIDNYSISAKSKTHQKVHTTLAHAKKRVYDAEKQVLSVLKKDPQKALKFASALVTGIGSGILAGLEEANNSSKTSSSKKKKKAKRKSFAKKRKK